jgi:hypothetical protein
MAQLPTSIRRQPRQTKHDEAHMAVWHLGFSSTKRGTLYPDEAQRRRAVHALVAAAGESLALFNIVNRHKHVLIRKQGSIAKVSGDIQSALSAVSEEPLNDPWTERVEGTKHQASLLRYILQQPSHHDVEVHDALWTGSCFLDLAGARIIDGLRLQIWDLLPNVSRSIIYQHVGLPGHSIEPVSLAEIRVLGAARLVAAASAALAADPLLSGRTKLERRGRGLAVELGQRAGIRPSEMRWALNLPRTNYHRALQEAVEETEMLAVRKRLALEEAVVKAGKGVPATEVGRCLRLCV